MWSAGRRSLDGQLYRAALALCPGRFRREHGEDMARDFDQARGETVSAGDRAIWMFRLLMAVDLARTIGVQWLRTGLPAIGLASVFLSLSLTEALAMLMRRASFRLPSDAAHAELLGVMLLAVTAVMLIAVTIALNLWVNRPRRIGRR